MHRSLFPPLALALALLGACASSKSASKAQLYYELGMNLMSEDKVPAALSNLQEAAKLDPDRPEILMHLGIAYMKLGNDAKAEEALSRALELQPDSPDLMNNLSAFYLQAKKPEKAALYAQQALQILTYQTPELALANLAQAQVAMKQKERALGTLEDALKRSPDNCAVRMLYSRTLYQNGRDSQAMREARLVQKRCPLKASGHLWEAYLLYKHRRRQDSQAKYQQTLELMRRGPGADQAQEALFNLKNHVPPPEPGL